VGILLGVLGAVSAVTAVAVEGPSTPAVAGESSTASAVPARCPLKPSSAIPSGDAWAFSETGPPSTPHPGITSSYTHGRGTWTGGRGGGTICSEDSAPARPSHNLVLTVSGSARISPGITRLGRLGTGLVLNMTVAASDDQACPAGTRGTVTMFASYYQGHHDSVRLHFTSACAGYDYTFLGSALYALIAKDGHQVNSA